MARSSGFSTNLNTKRQSTGMRPLIVFSLISVLLLTFYIREGEAGPIHAVRSGVTTITSPVRFLGSAVAAPFNAIGNVFSNLTASQDTLDELKKQNEELTSKVAELSEAQRPPSDWRVWSVCSRPTTSSPLQLVSSALRVMPGPRPLPSIRVLPTGLPSTCP